MDSGVDNQKAVQVIRRAFWERWVQKRNGELERRHMRGCVVEGGEGHLACMHLELCAHVCTGPGWQACLYCMYQLGSPQLLLHMSASCLSRCRARYNLPR